MTPLIPDFMDDASHPPVWHFSPINGLSLDWGKSWLRGLEKNNEGFRKKQQMKISPNGNQDTKPQIL